MLFSLFKHEEPDQYEECSNCKGEGVVEWSRITVINQTRSIVTPYLFHCKKCSGEGMVKVTK